MPGRGGGLGARWGVETDVGEVPAGRDPRFGELGRRVPTANTKTLTRQLRELEQDGIVTRKVFEQVPPKVEYSLTEWGLSLAPLVALMNEWGTAFVDSPPSSRW